MSGKILYIGYYTDDSILYEIQKRKINNMSIARQNFEKNLLSELIKKHGDNLDILTYAPVKGGYELPQESVLCGKTIRHIGIKKSSPISMLKAKKEFRKYLFELGREKLYGLNVIMYDVNPIFMIPLLKLRKKYKLTITTICAEVSLLRRGSGLISYFKKRILFKFEKKFDRYILFADAMAEVLKCRKKPCMVLEGIAPTCFGAPNADRKNIIMYAGGLAKDNNIRLLIDSCSQITELDELWICGVGEDEEYIAYKMKEYPWLRYFGMLTNDEVRKMETQAKILINLRSPDKELTKYSFPSKLLEYVASGSLVVTTRLEGIPKEYFNYFIAIDFVEQSAVVEVLTNTLKMAGNEYISRCVAAQEFIIRQKSADAQAKRIWDFINS